MTDKRKDEIKTDSEKLDLIYQWVMKQNQFREPTKKVNTLPFEVAESDAAIMNWHDAMKCGKDGWRLSTIDELNLIYENKEQFKGLNLTGSDPSGWYWSSSPYYDFGGCARVQRLSDGSQDGNFESFGLSVRLVRS